MLIGHDVNHALNATHNVLYCIECIEYDTLTAGDDDETNDTRACGD